MRCSWPCRKGSFATSRRRAVNRASMRGRLRRDFVQALRGLLTKLPVGGAISRAWRRSSAAPALSPRSLRAPRSRKANG